MANKSIDSMNVIGKDRVKVSFAVPSRNVWMAETAVSFAAMVAASVNEIPNLDLCIDNTMGTGLVMNRINSVQKAIDKECDYILFIDDDMAIPMGTLIMLLAHQKPVVAANCARKELPPRPTAKGFDDELVYTRETSKGLEQVKSVGTGIMLIHTGVFKEIHAPWFYENPIKRIGEDVHFCNQCTEKGIPIYIDHDLSKEVGHIGDFNYNHKLMKEWKE